jgi:hypothetical protein
LLAVAVVLHQEVPTVMAAVEVDLSVLVLAQPMQIALVVAEL